MEPLNRKIQRGPMHNVPLEKPKRKIPDNNQIKNNYKNNCEEKGKQNGELKETLILELEKAQKRIEELKVEEKRIKTRARQKELRKKSNVPGDLMYLSKRLSNTNRHHEPSLENQMNDYSFLKNSTLLEFFDQEEKQEQEQKKKQKEIVQIRGLKQELMDEQQYLRQMMNSLLSELKMNRKKKDPHFNIHLNMNNENTNLLNLNDDLYNEMNIINSSNINFDSNSNSPTPQSKHPAHKMMHEAKSFVAFGHDEFLQSPSGYLNTVGNSPSPIELEGESLILNS